MKRCLSFLLFVMIFWQNSSAYAVENTLHLDDWYLSQPDESATIQMSGHASEAGAIAYIDSVQLTGDIGYYRTRYKDKPWYAVTYGSFKSLDEARNYLKTLSNGLQSHSPWPRTFKVIKSLIDTGAVQTGDSTDKTAVAVGTDTESRSWEDGQAAYDNGNYNLAFEIWLKLAKQGDELSQFNLGVMYSRGDGTEKNYNEAIKWYTQSAVQGYAPAQFNLGTAYLDDTSPVVDKQKTAIWWKKAAEQGFVPAQFNLASLYCQGIGVTRDMDKCKFWYRRAASNGDTLARRMLEQLDSTETDSTSADQRNQTREQAKTVSRAPVDETKAARAALNPDVRKVNAQEHILLRKAQSAFTRNNYMKSYTLWLPLAESGIAEAQYSLGFLYQSGWGPERDLHKAVTWYTSAAEQNEARAQFNLGVLLLTGEEGVDEDKETALIWLARSAKNKNARAREFLVELYSKGGYGIEKSDEKAEYWRSQ